VSERLQLFHAHMYSLVWKLTLSILYELFMIYDQCHQPDDVGLSKLCDPTLSMECSFDGVATDLPWESGGGSPEVFIRLWALGRRFRLKRDITDYQREMAAGEHNEYVLHIF
jgi:hypothetical protein